MSKDLALAAAGSVLLHALCIAVPLPGSAGAGEEGAAPDFRVLGTVCLVGDLEGGPEDRPSPLPAPPTPEPVRTQSEPEAQQLVVPQHPPPMPGAAEDCGNPRGTETALPEPLPALPAQDSNRPRLLEEAATARAHPEPETRSAPIEAPIASTAPREKPPHLEKKPAHVPPAGPAGSAAAGRAGVPGDLEAARGAPGGPRERYLAALLRRLQAEKRYPPDARRKNWEGEAEVGIALGADGSLLDVRLEKSSHHAVLDEEATALILRAAPFPPLPRELGLDKWRLVIPIRFRIENRK